MQDGQTDIGMDMGKIYYAQCVIYRVFSTKSICSFISIYMITKSCLLQSFDQFF